MAVLEMRNGWLIPGEDFKIRLLKQTMPMG